MIALIARYRVGSAIFSECLGPALALHSSEYRCLQTSPCQCKKSLLPSSTSRKMKNMAFVKKWNAENTLLYGPKQKIPKKMLKQRAAEYSGSIDIATTEDAISDAEYGLIADTSYGMQYSDMHSPPDPAAPDVVEPIKSSVPKKRVKKPKTKAITPLTPPSVPPLARPSDDTLGDFPQLDEVLHFPLFRPSAELAGQVITEVGALTTLPCQRVTRILEQTRSAQSKMALDRWIQQQIELLGKEHFEKAQEARLRVASSLHGCVEQFLLGTPEHLLNLDGGVLPYWDSLQGALRHVEEVIGVEVKMEHAELRYTGTADCIAKYKGELCVIDWKTSGKSRPSLGSLFDYPLQVAAYLGALHFNKLGPLSDNERDIMSLLIVVAYEDGSPAHAHYIPRRQVLGFWGEWTKRLHQYWTGVLSQHS